MESVLSTGKFDIKNAAHQTFGGIATSGGVLSTLRGPADKDYQLTALSGCCVDGDEKVQHVLLSKVFPRQVEVVQASVWSERLKLEGFQ